MAKLSDIEGIGETYANKLKNAGIGSTQALLDSGSSKKGRKKIAEESGVSEKRVLAWVNRADLSRIKGVSTQYADLLEAAGVDGNQVLQDYMDTMRDAGATPVRNWDQE